MARTTPILHQNNLLFTFNSKISPSLFFFQPRTLSSSFHFNISLSSSISTSTLSSCRRITRVTTVPVEYAPPAPDFDADQEIARLRILRSRLLNCKSLKKKVEVIDSDSRVKRFFNSRKNGAFRVFAAVNLDMYQLFLLKYLVAAGQEHVLYSGFELGGGEYEEGRGSLKSALYVLADMIENWDVNGGKSFGKKSNANQVLHLKDEEVATLKQLLKTLEEVEMFYNCIGGIIG